jgi:Fe2+ or Zn2+ uptake regulation protein
MPSVAAATIYTVLDLLVDLGLARRIAVGGGTAVYDAMLEPHHHVVCAGCGTIWDLPVAVELEGARAAAAATGFRVTSVEVVVQGRCEPCSGTAAAG